MFTVCIYAYFLPLDRPPPLEIRFVFVRYLLIVRYSQAFLTPGTSEPTGRYPIWCAVTASQKLNSYKVVWTSGAGEGGRGRRVPSAWGKPTAWTPPQAPPWPVRHWLCRAAAKLPWEELGVRWGNRGGSWGKGTRDSWGFESGGGKGADPKSVTRKPIGNPAS